MTAIMTIAFYDPNYDDYQLWLTLWLPINSLVMTTTI